MGINYQGKISRTILGQMENRVPVSKGKWNCGKYNLLSWNNKFLTQEAKTKVLEYVTASMSPCYAAQAKADTMKDDRWKCTNYDKFRER